MPILARSGERWYQVPGGYISREAFQPILPYSRPPLIDPVGDGFWAEVVAPSSAIREWCAGVAPVIARLGFGAVVYVIDRLVDDHNQVWYGLAAAPGSARIGWAAALHYNPWNGATTPEPFPASVQLRLQPGALLIEDSRRFMGKIEVDGRIAYAGKTVLRAVQPGAAPADYSINSIRLPLGLPWLMRLDAGPWLYGAWWHNRFGLDVGTGNSPDIELPTLAARWLYAWLICHDSTTMLTFGE